MLMKNIIITLMMLGISGSIVAGEFIPPNNVPTPKQSPLRSASHLLLQEINSPRVSALNENERIARLEQQVLLLTEFILAQLNVRFDYQERKKEVLQELLEDFIHRTNSIVSASSQQMPMTSPSLDELLAQEQADLEEAVPL
jgi:hypothetical protein